MATTMTPSELQELGKRYYGFKEYQKALDAFTEGIEASDNPEVGLMDNRAATFEKLENLEAALLDGKRMIQLGKKDVRGYLRSGKVLQKMQKPDVALRIYEYGLRNVPASDKDYKLLQGMHNKLSRKISPPKAIDPWTVLPLELVGMVMGYFSFREMVNLLRVSRHWFKFLTTQQSLWTTLDLSHARRAVKPRFVRECIRRSNGKIRRAILNRLPGGGSDTLMHLTTVCRHLQELEIWNGPEGGSILVPLTCAPRLKILKLDASVQLTLDQVAQVLRSRPSLQHAEFCSVRAHDWIAPWKDDLPNLQALKLVGADLQDVDTLCLGTLVKRMPNLEELSLINWRQCTAFNVMNLGALPLKSLDLSDTVHEHFCRIPTCLKKLAVSCPLADLSILGHMLPVPNVVELSVSKCGPYVERMLTGLLSNGNSEDGNIDVDISSHAPIKKLLLHELGRHDQGTLRRMLQNPRFLQLEHLDLTEAPCVRDELALSLPTFFPSLRRLSLTWTRITGVAVKGIVQQLKGRLQYLCVDYSLDITSDAIDWARAQGVEVSNRRTTAESQGRKLRDAW
ncbi:hypothetical protein H2201_001521 [Coniosporium apollinis]|uniref:F-box domain-containing protein n=1 Tax=Coniosporium apollinis TaxID=61459 RepID=A0ABQ9P2I8_9PEZI|nr:hypothetical protein H2201_001521 [Coniosporium apollinis]